MNNTKPYLVLKEAEDFLRANNLALVGVSSNRNKFGSVVFRTLVKAGYKVVPVNPHLEELEGVKCYKKLSQIEPAPGGVVIITKPEKTLPVLAECRSLGINKVWFQPGAESKEATAFCEKNNITAFTGHCILLPSKSFPHNLHLFFLRLFGRAK